MRKTRAKTTLKVTLEPEGGAHIETKWANADMERKQDVAKEIIARLSMLPDYRWLFEILDKAGYTVVDIPAGEKA